MAVEANRASPDLASFYTCWFDDGAVFFPSYVVRSSARGSFHSCVNQRHLYYEQLNMFSKENRSDEEYKESFLQNEDASSENNRSSAWINCLSWKFLALSSLSFLILHVIYTSIWGCGQCRITHSRPDIYCEYESLKRYRELSSTC
jgi:hypothetical protein